MGGLRLSDPGRRLRRQAELELLQEELVILLRLGIAGEDERTVVRGGEVNVQHLDGGELLKHGAGRQPRRQGTQALLQRHLKAMYKEGHEDVTPTCRLPKRQARALILAVDGVEECPRYGASARAFFWR